MLFYNTLQPLKSITLRKPFYLLLLSLSACIGPEWNYHQSVDCQKGDVELSILQNERDRLLNLVATNGITASSLISPDEEVAALLGGDYAHAKEIVLLDYADAVELRSNEISATCQIAPTP